MSGARIRLVIVEDEHLYRDLLRTVLQLALSFEVVGDYATPEEALERIPALAPQVALIDIELQSVTNGVQLGLLLRQQLPSLGIVLLSNVRAPRLLASIPPSEAAGWSYLLKRSVQDIGVLQRAIAGASEGLVTIDPTLISGLHVRERGPLARLTPRQFQILRLLAEGTTNEEIAQRLDLSVKTIENQLVQIYQQLGLDRSAEPIHPRVRAVLLYLAETREAPLPDRG